jgi:phosphate acetyltransferase
VVKQTQPGLPVVSSVFFMCLPGKVLVYGDCAINSNPSSEELAAIAVASADTAAAFGITPRVAMLSYATGDSNTGGWSHLSEPVLTLPITTQRPCDRN